MAAQKVVKNLSIAKVIGYADIAEKMGVKVHSVRIYAGRDPDFPEPVTPASLRSPGFNEDDVDRWIQKRKKRGEGKAGRAPRSADSENSPAMEVTPKTSAGTRAGRSAKTK